ncbi:CHAT domain-containing protein [Flammeovirga aprica]|uniref:CHAT domain-containing protein n=1 Tax=Flammeovirga aprica JL-4 TaxID=694437 RepID=A0A7X9RW88_9BACT|nr:CHAT domain-containing protein [Flammeovirga aprica]NME69876.1 CHAT domain-containing protein [Flammeovirga aprica JL-4]
MKLLTAFLVFLSVYSSAQTTQQIDKEINYAYDIFRDRKYREALSIFLRCVDTDPRIEKRSLYQNCIGHIYGKELLMLDSGIYWIEKSIETIENDTSGTHHFTYVRNHNKISQMYSHKGDYVNREYYIRKGANIFLDCPEKYKYSQNILRKLNNLFYRRKEYHLSEQAVSLYLELIEDDDKYPILADHLSLWVKIDNPEKIQETLQEIEYFLVNDYVRNKHGYSGIHFYYLGLYAQSKNKYEEAINFYKKYLVLKKDRELNNYTDYFQSIDEYYSALFYSARTLKRIAQCYKFLGDRNNEGKYLKESLGVLREGHHYKDVEITFVTAEIYRELELYERENNVDYIKNTSNLYLDSAQLFIDSFIAEYNLKDTSQLIVNELLHQKYYYAVFSEQTSQKKQLYWDSYLLFKQFLKKQYLDKDHLYQFSSRKKIQDNIISFFAEEYLKDHQIEDLLRVLEIIENSKSNILYKRSQGFGDITLEEYLEADDLDQLRNRTNNPPLLSSSEMKSFFGENYNEKAFVSYYPLENQLVIISYVDGQFDLELKPFPANWITLIATVHKELKTSILNSNNSIGKQLSALGSFLLPKALLDSEIERVVFSPANELSEIPFDILKYHDAYFLEKWASSYSFSLHHEFVTDQKTASDDLRIMGVAPYNKINLPYSKKEVDEFSDFVLSDTSATLSNTLRYSKDYNVLHFATHTTINENIENSKIDFYPTNGVNGDLFLSEIDKIDLSHLDLVTLSSCHSADGPYIGGEGTLSLQRVFAYSNVKAIVASKWEVNDQVSALIMKSFYENIQKGYPLDKALQKARLELLEDNKAMRANPLYWGNFVLYGKTTALTSSGFEKFFEELLD